MLLEPAVHGWWALAGFYAHQGAYKITQELETLHESLREPVTGTPGQIHKSRVEAEYTAPKWWWHAT